jgi:NAD(P)H-hydrate epimerase
VKLVDAASMRALDQRTIQAGTPGRVLMERAGMGAAEVFMNAFPNLVGREIGVVSGKGNNGGDGLVIARALCSRGTPARVWLLGREADLRGDPATMLAAARRAGVRVDAVTGEGALDSARRDLEACAGLVDAIFGTGLERPVEGLPRAAIDLLKDLATNRRVMAVDIPSGVDATTGAVLGAAIRADLTVTFGLPKLGHVLFPGAGRRGRLAVVDIGIPPAFVEEAGLREGFLTHAGVLATLPARPADAHKGTFGHLLVLAGSPGKTGAAALTSQAAMRCGTGLVTLASPESLNAILAAKLTEVMCEPCPETDARTLGRKAMERLPDLAQGKTALAVGPGLSTHPETRELVIELARNATLPLLLDADGLNALAGRADLLLDARGPRVLTPHPGEMARLLGIDGAAVNADRIGLSRRLAGESGAVVVLKGAHTVVASPEGEVRINTTGNPGMASGGMGDALSGLIAGFLAQGVAPSAAAGLGVYLHGLAADRAARERGMIGLLASDVIDRIPRTLEEMRAGKGDAAF